MDGFLLPDGLFAQLSALAADRLGLQFPENRRRSFERGIKKAAAEFGFQDAETCARWILSSSMTGTQLELLASHITVGETYFFRDETSFRMLENRILPELIQARRETDRSLRMWSAGCATGEEPYSLAILIRKLIPDLHTWRVTILATDINPRFLKHASTGVYKDWSFRNTPPWIKQQYFTRHREHGAHALIPEIRDLVTFELLNLADDGYPSLVNDTTAMDVILCRNVMMYFAPEQAQRIQDKFYLALRKDGWLLVAPSETAMLVASRFVPVRLPGAILYRKGAPVPRMESAPMIAAPVILPAPIPEPIIPVRSTETVWDDRIALHPPAPVLSPYEKALALYEEGQSQRVVETLTTGLNGPEDAPAMALISRACANYGDLNQALTWIDRAVSVDRLTVEYHYLRAMILQEQEDLPAAAATLKRALYIDHSFVLAHVALGHLALRQRKRNTAVKHFKRALECLNAYGQEETMPVSDGLTAGRLREMISASINAETKG